MSRPEFSRQALEHLGALYGFAMTLTGDQTESQDLVQETYLKAVGASKRLVPESNFKSWLFTIMRNIWLHQLRHARIGPRFIELDAEEGIRDRPDAQMVSLRKIKQGDLHKLIESLPPLYREVLVLRYIEGFTNQQIAGILGCPTGTVMSRLARARGKLRAHLVKDPRSQLDALLARMQKPKTRAGMKSAFNASPTQLGKAAVEAARNRDRGI
jgi:RNA polymerase sigma-70 factor (ECF subfamily)